MAQQIVLSKCQHENDNIQLVLTIKSVRHAYHLSHEIAKQITLGDFWHVLLIRLKDSLIDWYHLITAQRLCNLYVLIPILILHPPPHPYIMSSSPSLHHILVSIPTLCPHPHPYITSSSPPLYHILVPTPILHPSPHPYIMS